MKRKANEWLRRYLIAEILGTLGALVAAWVVFSHTHSYVAAAASGWIGEGIGFYGYFVCKELFIHAKKYREHRLFQKIGRIVAAASTNLFVEFAPAEIMDNVIIRPFLMFLLPQHIKPYAAGFLTAKFSADILFYLLAIIGYETKNRWLHR
ncbi:MAG TPA: hypothetical protein VFL85_01345 [Candidatus Saccharimonadales bacterium]|nr:hypothetical protein [Candidatus Saccharimonadales bacterium]